LGAAAAQSARSSQVARRNSDIQGVTDVQMAQFGGPSDAEDHPSGGTRGYLRAAEAAALLHVSPKTISRWAREGKLGHVVTLGGHRRFSRSDIEHLAERMVIDEL
jgi:excisionase family DNA binding protein